ncbi:hypothetical protein [Spiroplasma endosymbiont of Virgichneumon dumeticola]|uniref:hypothetical protein n=1 Tax=Spiroplasma endosymbiont of Virgichneumon dumeticola TaxID=3139323 RepID=UPI0035C92334
MTTINLELKSKVRETEKGILLEIGEYETWFSTQYTTIDNKNKKILIKIFEDWNYKLGKKSITNDISSIKGSEILKYVKNIPNVTANENELISCEFYEQYNGYYNNKWNKDLSIKIVNYLTIINNWNIKISNHDEAESLLIGWYYLNKEVK